MAYVAPSTVTTLQTYTSAAHNIIVNDIIDHESRLNSYAGVYANEAARDAAITSPTEGMSVYLTAPTVPAATGLTPRLPTGITTTYNGTVWVCTTEVGSGQGDATASSAFGTSYADMTFGGTAISVTLVTGTTACVSFGATIAATAGRFDNISVKTGTVAASAAWGAYNQSDRYCTVQRTFVMGGLTAGTNTFTIQSQSNTAGDVGYYAYLVVKGIA